MPVEVESTSQIDEFQKVLRRKIWWIVLPAAVFITIGTSFAVIVPKKYVTRTRVMVRNTTDDDGRGGANGAREAQVASHQIRSPARIAAVLQDLRWPEYLELNREEQYKYVMRTEDNVDVVIPIMPREAGQQEVKMTFSHTEPDRAYTFLLTLRQKWQAEVVERGRVAEKKAFERLKETKANLERNREEITEELAQWRKEHRIAPTAASVGAIGTIPTYDPVFQQIRTQEPELEEMALEAAELQQKITLRRDRWARMQENVPVVETEAGIRYEKDIQDRREQILNLQQQINDNGYKALHPKRRQIEEKIRNIEEDIELLRQNEVEAVQKKFFVPNETRIKLKREIDDLEEELDHLTRRMRSKEERMTELNERARELQDVYARIRTLEAQLDTVNATLQRIDGDYQKKKQTVDWIEGPGGDPFEVLEKVHLPTEPSEPNPILIIIFSVFAGLGVGLGAAVLSEYGKNCFRSVHDINRVMVIPVLGTVNAIVTRREARKTLMARLAGGAATLVFVSSLGFITWAWKEKPHLLSDPVRDVIEDFRDSFK